jgi:hypothetical protein
LVKIDQLPKALPLARIHQSTWRDCPKSLKAAFSVALAAASEFLFRRFGLRMPAKSTLAESLDRLPDGFESQPLGRSVISEKKPPLAAVRNET